MNATRRVMQGMRKRQHSGRQEAENWKERWMVL